MITPHIKIKSPQAIKNKKKRDPKFQLGHRRRLFDKMRKNLLTDYEMLEVLLTFAIARRDVRPLARELIYRFGNYHSVLLAPSDLLMEVPGVGPRVVEIIQTAHKSCIFESRGIMETMPVLKEKDAILNYCKFKIGIKNIEEAHAIYLNAKGRMIIDDLLNIGTNNHVNIIDRNILARAMYLNADRVILVHNHPCAGAKFSRDDLDTTLQLRKYLARENITLLDHILVCGGLAYSLNNELHVL